jgi:hypothetical protein
MAATTKQLCTGNQIETYQMWTPNHLQHASKEVIHTQAAQAPIRHNTVATVHSGLAAPPWATPLTVRNLMGFSGCPCL